MQGYEDLIANGGIKKKILQAGNGDKPTVGETVSVHYVGKLESNGKEFDSSDDPFKFILGVGQVIKGWDVGVASMKVGEKCELYIKSDYAYGSRGAGNVIPPNATLIFEVTLLEIL